MILHLLFDLYCPLIQANRALASGFLLIEFIPGGKLLKPITKGLKAGTKATVKGSRKIYKYFTNSRPVFRGTAL